MLDSLGHTLVLAELGPSRKPATMIEEPAPQCPICLDPISDMVELSCNHRFCWKCFVLGPIAFQPGEYRMTQCPICRKDASVSSDPPQEADNADDINYSR